MSSSASLNPAFRPDHPQRSESKKKKADPRRWYTALIFIPLLYAWIAYSPSWLFSILVGATVLLALREFLILYFGGTAPLPAQILSYLGAIGILLDLHEGFLPAIQGTGLGIVLLILAGFFLNPRGMRNYLPLWSAYPFGCLYVALLLGHFILLRNMEQGIAIVLFVLIVTWLSDTGGYVVGRTFGRHPLAPRVSPKKTIEGFLGGIVFSLVGALMCQAWFFSFISQGQSIFLGVVLALCGTLGDLTESAIKRSVNIKDSGRLIPGHGGILDRIDSLLLSAPGFYYYALATGLLG